MYERKGYKDEGKEKGRSLYGVKKCDMKRKENEGEGRSLWEGERMIRGRERRREDAAYTKTRKS